LNLQLSPEVDWLRLDLNACADEQNLVLQVSSAAEQNLDLTLADITVSWNGQISNDAQAFEIGRDRLAIIVNPSNQLTNISTEQLAAIYQGEITTWNQLEEGLPAETIHFWTTSNEDNTRQLFEKELVGILKVDGTASLAPHAEQMRTAISQDPLSIGFLPARWVDGTIREVALIDGTSVEKPIVAQTVGQPDQDEQIFLGCLTNRLSPGS
jgi:ABC-type phosphate transport system substrate-binding protein